MARWPSAAAGVLPFACDRFERLAETVDAPRPSCACVRALSVVVLMWLLVGCQVGQPPTAPEASPIPVDELIAYGAQHADQFGGLYIDNNAGGVVVMLFTAALERHQQAVAALAPAGVRVQIRVCRFTEAELTALMDELVADAELSGQLEEIGIGLDTINNVVILEAKSNDAGLKERLEARFGGMLKANIHPIPGPWQNRPDGDGWRLLSAGTVLGSPNAYMVRVASTDAEWLALWAELATGTEMPEVDFDSEIVAAFGEGISRSCPELRLDDVVINTTLGLVHSVTSDPLAHLGCNFDLAGAALFVVALSRSALPDSPFTVRLRQELICGSCHEEELTVDLR